MPYDPVAYNQLIEISMFTNDVRYLQAKSNEVADTLSRPSNVPIGAAYDVPQDGPLVDVTDVIAAVEPEPAVTPAQIASAETVESRARDASGRRPGAVRWPLEGPSRRHPGGIWGGSLGGFREGSCFSGGF